MIINKKKILTVAAIAVGAVSVLGISYIVKKRNAKIENTDEETVTPEIVTDDAENFNEVELEEEVEEEIEETNNNLFADEDKLIRYELIKYLAKNGVDENKIMIIGKIVLDIQEDLPDESNKIKHSIEDVINSEYSEELIDSFYNYCYNLLYTSMIPCDIFVKYADKIERMGEECQPIILDLVEALDGYIENKNPEAINAFADLYNFLKYNPEERFNENTYEEKFKKYVEIFVTSKNEEEQELATKTASEFIEDFINEVVEEDKTTTEEIKGDN